MSVTFVSIGDGEKLTKFLELNPDLPKDRCFVDESRTFDVYRAAGFGKIGDTKPTDINIKPPGFSFAQWLSYLANVATLAPIRKDEPLRGPPEGVLRLGGDVRAGRRGRGVRAQRGATGNVAGGQGCPARREARVRDGDDERGVEETTATNDNFCDETLRRGRRL